MDMNLFQKSSNAQLEIPWRKQVQIITRNFTMAEIIACKFHILMEILHCKNEAVLARAVPLKHFCPLPQQMGDTFGMPIFCSKKKWRLLEV